MLPSPMTFVVTTNCEGCRFTDCAVCVPVCPVGAIFADIDLPGEQEPWLDINRERAVRLPVVNAREPEPEGARELARARGFPVI